MTKPRKPIRRRAKRRRTYSPAASASRPAGFLRTIPEERYEVDRALSWYVVRTGVRREANVSHGLKAECPGVFFPSFLEEHRRRSRTREVRRALFPRYLFVGLDRNQFEDVRSVDGVECILSIAGCPVPVDPTAIQLVADAIAAHAPGDGRPTWTLRAGDTAVVLTGPFAQYTARIVGEPRDGVVKTEIALFGRKTPVELPVDDLEAA